MRSNAPSGLIIRPEHFPPRTVFLLTHTQTIGDHLVCKRNRIILGIGLEEQETALQPRRHRLLRVPSPTDIEESLVGSVVYAEGIGAVRLDVGMAHHLAVLIFLLDEGDHIERCLLCWLFPDGTDRTAPQRVLPTLWIYE